MFAPKLVPSLAALLAVLLFVRLGFWQMHRADESRARQALLAEHAQLSPIDLNRVPADAIPSMLWRSATVRGHWQAQAQVLLDNQTAAGRAGYRVFGLLLPTGCSCVLLVDRGWIAAGPYRAQAPGLGRLPDFDTLRGSLAPFPSGGIGVRNGVEFLPGGVVRVQRLEVNALPMASGLRLLPVILRPDPNPADGARRKPAPPDLRADRHMAYAVQWFAFALIAAILYFSLNLRRR